MQPTDHVPIDDGSPRELDAIDEQAILDMDLSGMGGEGDSYLSSNSIEEPEDVRADLESRGLLDKEIDAPDEALNDPVEEAFIDTPNEATNHAHNDAHADAPYIQQLRIPPHSNEAESSVLGGVLLDNSSWDKIGDLLSEDDFYRYEHKLIFGAIFSLMNAARAVDTLTVFEHLKSQGKAQEASI